MDKTELQRRLTAEEFTLQDVLDAVVDINGIIGVGLISLGDDIAKYLTGKKE